MTPPLRSTDWISRRRIKNLLKRVRKLDVGWLIKWMNRICCSPKQTNIHFRWNMQTTTGCWRCLAGLLYYHSKEKHTYQLPCLRDSTDWQSYAIQPVFALGLGLGGCCRQSPDSASRWTTQNGNKRQIQIIITTTSLFFLSDDVTYKTTPSPPPFLSVTQLDC